MLGGATVRDRLDVLRFALAEMRLPHSGEWRFILLGHWKGF